MSQEEVQTTELYSGIVIAIDEAIGTGNGDQIEQIIEQIDIKSIPICKYTALPTDDNFFRNLRSVGFIILDWDLHSSPAIEDGIQLGDALRNEAFRANIDFLKKVQKHCFAPVFIFTNNASTAIEWLTDEGEGLYDPENEDKNFVLVRSKSSVADDSNLFETVEGWINAHSALYTLKNWESSFYKAKNELFWDLFSKSSKWPEVLWKSFEDDMVDPISNFNDTIFRLIMSRTFINDLDKDKIVKEGEGSIDKEEVKEVVKGLMYLDADKLNPNEVRPGDIFKTGGKYWLNIRPECDTITGRCDGDVYLVKGSKLTSGQAPRFFGERYSQGMGLHERHDEVVLFGVDGNDFVVFKFNEIRKEQFAQLISDDKRKCRVLHPFINSIQQKYASYTGRVGLPRFPHDLMMEVVPELAVKKEDDTQR